MSLRGFLLQLLWLGASVAPSHGAPVGRNDDFDVKPFTVDLSAELARMLGLVTQTKLPEDPVYPAVGSSAGIDLDTLKRLKTAWTEDFDWSAEEADINR